MSIAPIITFKAGQCQFDESTGKVKPDPTPGYVYLHSQEDLMHFCWRPRGASVENAELDLIMFPTDGTFTPYQKKGHQWPNICAQVLLKLTTILLLATIKVTISVWRPILFSTRDLKIGEVVNDLLQGEEVNVEQAVAEMQAGHPPGDDDATMEDVEGHGTHGGDIRDEGEDAREGGADGGRATAGEAEAQTIIQNFINSMPGGSNYRVAQQKLFTTLQDLLTPTTTVAWIDTASEATLDHLMQFLPPNLTTLARDEGEVSEPPMLSLDEKRDLLRRVLRSPQFAQSLGSLTFALRDGGLPTVSDALNIPVHNGGFMRRGGVPLGGGEAVEAFLSGVRDLVEKDSKDDGSMDTS